MEQTITLSNGKAVTLSDNPYAGKILARVKSTFEGGWGGNNFQKGYSRPTATGSPPKTNGLPDTIQYNGNTNANDLDLILDEETQWWIYRICSNQLTNWDDGKKKTSFAQLLTGDRFWTNKTGSETNACYPCGTHLDAEPIIANTLFTGHAIIELASDQKSRVYGVDHYPFYCINLSKPHTHYHPSTHPFLFYKPLNSVRTKILNANGVWTGEYKEDGYQAFPQFDNKAILPILMAVTDVGWINAKAIQILDTSQPLPPPFNM